MKKPLPPIYREWAQKAAPLVKAALANQERIPKPLSQSEAILTLALFWNESPILLDEFIAYVDALDHSIPGEDETAWTFVQLQKRGWLLVDDDRYGLTPEGRRVLSEIAGNGDVHEMIDRLKRWLKANPL